MNNLLNIKTPAEPVAQTRKADYNLSNQGVGNLRLAYWNLPTEALVEEAVFRSEGALAAGGAFVATTGKHTARSANDKFVVRHTDSENNIWWGVYNRPFAEDKFEVLYDRMLGFLQGKDVFVQDVYAGADDAYRLPVRIVTELAWHSHFVRNMFLLPQSLDEYKRFVPEFRPAVSFAEGIRQTIAWFDADPARRGVDAGMDEWMDRLIDVYDAGLANARAAFDA